MNEASSKIQSADFWLMDYPSGHQPSKDAPSGSTIGADGFLQCYPPPIDWHSTPFFVRLLLFSSLVLLLKSASQSSGRKIDEKPQYSGASERMDFLMYFASLADFLVSRTSLSVTDPLQANFPAFERPYILFLQFHYHITFPLTFAISLQAVTRPGRTILKEVSIILKITLHSRPRR